MENKGKCINCAHLRVREKDSEYPMDIEWDGTGYGQIEGRFVCDFYKERARVTSPHSQTCGENWVDVKVIMRDKILNEILNG